MLLSFIIPCYKSKDSIAQVVTEIIDTVNQKQKYDYEIILINDNSPDSTLQVITQLARYNKSIKVINLSRNFGQHSAIMAGFNFCQGDLIICLDDDGQTPPSSVFDLIDKIELGFDVIFASYKEKKHSLFRNLGSKINDLMAYYLINKPKGLYLSSYFVCRRFVAAEVIKYTNPYPYISGLLIRCTSKIDNIQVSHQQRKFGRSSYSFFKLVQLWLNGFTAFSIKPLRVATVSGGLFALCGFIYAIYIIFNKLIHPRLVLGYASLMSALLLIGGISMLMLGLIGEYLGRIYLSLNKSPQYVIRDKINLD